MPYAIFDIDLDQPLPTVALRDDQDGYALILRWRDRLLGFLMRPAAPGSALAPDSLTDLVEREVGLRVLAIRAEAALEERLPLDPAPEPVSLSIAVCTKDRAARLERLLQSLQAIREGSRFRALDVLVVDNASLDPSTRQVAEAFDGVRYLYEPRTGLDFARNTALRSATGDLLAYLDDDLVVDPGWLKGLYRVWRDCPDAGGYSGLVLPLRLDTESQIEFERAGGFGRGYARIHHGQVQIDNPLHPVGAGVVGAGCNMCFRRQLLLDLGGFDEALDTGAPLPGGGDLDIFYRVLRAGREIVYDPGYAVHHEHRETLAQLRRQYWSWGLGFMAYLTKARRTDRALRSRHAAMARWWTKDKLLALAAALSDLDWRRAGFVLAELRGAIRGTLGEYDRSAKRTQRIRERAV